VSLEIRELAPDLTDDYLAFFDNDAFADFPWWSACYCRFWDDPADTEGDSSPQHRDRYRALVTDLIRKGSQQGLLAVAEAYPTTAPPSGPYADQIPWSAHNHTGPLEMYRKAGFTLHRQLERFAVVRKSL